MFDNQKHADALLEIEGLVCYALMVSEGLQPANNQMGEKQYVSTAAGAFGLMAFALDRVFDLISEAESGFRLAHGLHYGK